MKKDIHPSYGMITYIKTDGTECQVKSTLASKFAKGKEKLTLQVDDLTHPAYTGKSRVLDTGGRVDKFNKRYGR